jgi:hypothetical protein
MRYVRGISKEGIPINVLSCSQLKYTEGRESSIRIYVTIQIEGTHLQLKNSKWNYGLARIYI